MPGFWKIVYYNTLSSKYPVKDFIDKLDNITQAKVSNSFDLLSEFDIKLRAPHTKKVASTPLWELRVLGKCSIRLFYVAKVDREFLMLHGFTKKGQKTPKKEIKTAFNRLREFDSRTCNIAIL